MASRNQIGSGKFNTAKPSTAFIHQGKKFDFIPDTN